MFTNNLIILDTGPVSVSVTFDCESCRLFKTQALPKTTSMNSTLQSTTGDAPSTLSFPDDLLISVCPAREPLDSVHTDTFQFDFPSGKHIYFFLFIDEATDFKVVFESTSKSAFITALQAYHAFAFYHQKKTIKALRLDNAGEMCSDEFYQFCRFNGIFIQRCTPYQHYQNGTAERGGRTMEEAALTCLHHAKLPIQSFIGYAFSNVVQIRNKCPTRKSMKSQTTPYELFHGVKPKMSDIHIIGQLCYSYTKKDQRKLKYNPKAVKCIYLCEDFERRAHLLFDIQNRSLVISRDVRFPTGGSSIFPPSLQPFSNSSERRSEEPHGGASSSYQSSTTASTGNTPHTNSQQEHSSSVDNLSLTIPELTSILIRLSHEDRIPDIVDGPATPALIAPESPGTTLRKGHTSPSTTDTDINSEDNTLASSHELQIEENLLPRNIPPRASGSSSSSSSSSSSYPILRLTFPSQREECHTDSSLPSTITEPIPVTVATQPSETAITPIDDEGSSKRRRNSRYYNSDFVNNVSLLFTPKSYHQAVTCPDKVKWDTAMKQELTSLQQQETWRLVARTADMFVVKSRWVYKIKLDQNGKPDRYKARLVAKGFTQLKGIHYDDTYSPVIQTTSRRLMLAMSTFPNMKTVQGDVEVAFVQSIMDKLIFLDPPPGLEVPKGFVLELLRALYGLKQASLLWFLTASNFLISIGFRRLVSDPCFFTLENSLGTAYLCLFVDDFTLSSTSQEMIDWIVSHLLQRFKLREVKPLSYLVGLRIESEEGTRSLFVSQAAFIDRLLRQHHVDERKRRSTPMKVEPDLDNIASPLLSDITSYRSLIGSLNYLAQQSRPDICFAVNSLSHFLVSPRRIHYDSAIFVLEYLNSTKTSCIIFHSLNDRLLIGFCDSSFPSKDSLHGRSITGYLIFYNGSLLAWKSKRQTTIAQSTMESEIGAIATTSHHLQYVGNILEELQYKIDSYTIRSDSDAAIKYIKGSPHEVKPRTRHLALKFHFLRHEYISGRLLLEYVPTKDNIADILTKPLAKGPFCSLRNRTMKM